MIDILATTAPTYAIILFGYVLGRLRIFSAVEFRALGRFVVGVAAPALLFTALSQLPIAAILQGSFLAAYAAASLAVFGIGAADARFGRRQGMPVAALTGLGMSSSNSVMIGYPIAQQVIGDPAAIALAMCVIVENLLMQPLMVAVAGLGARDDSGWRRVAGRALLRFATNPFVVGSVAGALVSCLQVPLPEVVRRTIGMLGTVTAPAALFVIGGSLVGLHLEGKLRDVARIAAGKLVAHPLCVFGAMLLVQDVDPALRVGAVLIASAPMLSIYPIWGQRFGEEKFCAAALLGTTIGSFATVSAVLLVVR